MLPLRTLTALLLAALPASFAAASKGVWEEYEQRVNAGETVGTVGPDQFGESVDFQRGNFSLRVTDVSLPGNSALPVEFTRVFATKTAGGAMRGTTPEGNARDGALADWEIDLPHVGGVYPQQSGWVHGNAQNGARCSAGTDGPVVQIPSGAADYSTFAPHEYSQGVKLHLPKTGDLPLLTPASGTPLPAGGARWITSNWTALSCLSSIKNGSGEGFVATTADGTRYWFDWMATAQEQPLTKSRRVRGINPWEGAGDAYHAVYDHLPRGRFGLYATRVEDRFGNWVNYIYSNAAGAPARLDRIEASDGRLVAVAYNAAGFVQSVTANARSWNYAYAGSGNASSLTTVGLPDGSAWTLDLAAFQSLLIRYYLGQPGDPWRNCTNPGDIVERSYTGSVRHPSGATATYRLQPVRFQRHGISQTGNCAIGDPDNPNDDTEWFPSAWDSYALVEKRVQGDGIAEQVWNYVYEAGDRTTVAGAGDYARYTYGNTFRVDEGKLLSLERGAAANAILQREDYTYELGTSGLPFPTPIGTTANPRNDDFAQEQLLPQKTRAILREGTTYTAAVTAYDGFGRALQTTKSNTLGHAKTETTVYHDDLNGWVLGLVASSAINGTAVAATQYDARSLPHKVYAFGKLESTLTYAADGTLATHGDGNGKVTTLSSWKRGLPQSVRFPATPEAPAGATRSIGVDDNGWVVSVTDESGAKTCYSYDSMGRVNRATYPSATQSGVCDASRWSETLSEFRQLGTNEWMPPGIALSRWRQYSERGNWRRATYYDALWRPVLVHEYDAADTTGTLRATRTTYDDKGRVTFRSYPSGALVPGNQGVHTVHDALDRVTRSDADSEHGLLGTTTEYLSGLRVRVTPPRGFPTTTSFLAWDEPDYAQPLRSEQPENKILEIVRHPQLGRPEQLVQRSADNSVGATRRYVYDAYGQLCKTVEPETGATVMDYDGAGNLTWQASGLDASAHADPLDCGRTAAAQSGRVVHRAYDARNRLTALNFPDGRGDEQREYTPTSLLARVTSYNAAGQGAAVQTSYTYDTRGLLASETVAQPGWYAWSIGYTYDALGHLSRQSYPTGLTLDFAPNAFGDATQVRDTALNTYASGATYYPNGALKQFTYGNGIVHTMTQNARQLPQRVTSTGIVDLGYTYDDNGNVADIWDFVRDTGNGQFGRWMTYDGLDRLTAAGSCTFGGDCWHRFTYDALDNLRSWKLAGVKDYAAYRYDGGNRLTEIRDTAGTAVVTIGYDAQGNLTDKNGQRFVFDYGNRLRETGGNGYRYDGHGRRVQVTAADGSRQLWQYTQAGQMLFSWEEQPVQKTHEHLYLAGSLIAIVDHAWPGNGVLATRYQHTDALGSPVAETDTTGALITRNDYEPFGAVIGKPQYTGVGYTGHVMDGGTGLTYMQQRYYDQQIGIFLSVDPVSANSETGENFSRYRYGNNNPYKFVDPDGRQAFIPAGAFRQGYVENASRTAQIDATRNRGERAGSEVAARRTSISAKGVMSAGSGFAVSKNIAGNGSDTISWVPVGQGLYAGSAVNFKLVDGASLFSASGDSPISFETSGDIGLGVSIGGSIALDPAGKLDISIRLGLGFGEHTSFSPLMNVELNESESKDQ